MPCSSRIESRSSFELGALARVETGGRLVEAEQRGLGAHRARDLEPALVAIGQIAGGIVGAVEQIDPLQPVGARGRSPRSRRRGSRAAPMQAGER